MRKKLLALSLAGALLAPQLGLASESRLSENDVGQASVSERFPLPAIPNLDTMPWINPGLQWRGPRIDTLLTPDLHLWTVSKNSGLASNTAEPLLGRSKADQ